MRPKRLCCTLGELQAYPCAPHLPIKLRHEHRGSVRPPSHQGPSTPPVSLLSLWAGFAAQGSCKLPYSHTCAPCALLVNPLPPAQGWWVGSISCQ